MEIDRPPATAKSPGPRNPRPTRGLARRLVLARAALVWESLWPAFWPLLGICGLFLALALFDLLPLLPGWLHAGALAAFGAALLAALWHLIRNLSWPPVEAARRRLERDSGLPHRPLEALDDKLVAGRNDRGASALWQAHRQRILAQAAKLRVRPPRAGLAGSIRWPSGSLSASCWYWRWP